MMLSIPPKFCSQRERLFGRKGWEICKIFQIYEHLSVCMSACERVRLFFSVGGILRRQSSSSTIFPRPAGRLRDCRWISPAWEDGKDTGSADRDSLSFNGLSLACENATWYPHSYPYVIPLGSFLLPARDYLSEARPGPKGNHATFLHTCSRMARFLSSTAPSTDTNGVSLFFFFFLILT